VFSKQLISVGNLVPGKRTDLAVRMLKILPAHVGLVIVGAGPEGASLEALVGQLDLTDRVTFLGAVPRTEVMSLLRQSDLLVHLSEHESAGWVVGEALTVGTAALVFAGSGADSVCRLTGSAPSGIADAPELQQLAKLASGLLQAGRGRESARWSRAQWQSDVADMYARAIAE
jgi:glycosyltransferase involved in cell wall biosynthesis